MYQAILRTPLLLFFLISTISFSFSQSPETIRFKAVRASEEEGKIYDSYFKSYTLATLSRAKVADLLKSKNHFSTLSLAFKDQEFRFELEAFDLRSADFTLRAATDTGVVELPREPNMTYRGNTIQGGFDVRITANERCFYGMIAQAHDVLYIEPAKRLAPSAPEDQFLIYWESDNLKKFPLSMCGTKDRPIFQGNPEEDAGHEIIHDAGSRACKTVQIALADDHFMFNTYGSVQACMDHNMAVINNVLTNYDFEFNDDLQFSIVTIFVATSDANDPWTNSTSIDAVLDDFTAWGPSGFGTTHDVASLWSSRDFDGNVIGLAWLDAVCTNFKYNVLQDFTNNANFLRVLQAHEMGHNFSAVHDPSGSTTIMAPVVNNTNTWSALSISDINSYIAGISCLGPCAPPAPPVADFSGNPTNGCAPMTVSFTDLSSNNPTSWSWSFPGGTPSSSTSQNPTVTYNNPGSFNVSLTATNANGSNTKTKTNYIVVGNFPFADFDYTVDEFTVDFDNLSQFGTSYFWNFGDGGTSTQANPIHVYNEDGTYTVTLTTSNSCGSDTYSVTINIITQPFADFSSDIHSGCDPIEVQYFNFSSDNAVSFFWSFPGGSPPTSTAFEPTIVYEIPGTYNVSLTAYNAAGEDTYTAFAYITVFPQPEADFTWVANGLSVSFNSGPSTGDQFFWNFGDGQTSTQANPVHLYAQGGTYNVLLNVTNSCGTNSITLTVTVNGAPTASFSSNTNYGCAPLIVQYTNTSAGNPTSFSWVFEGGIPATSTQANPVVTYNAPGIYDVQLTVTNPSGSNTIIQNDYIEVESPTVSNFSSVVTGYVATFTNLSQNATSYQWNFGDGQTSTESNPAHLYNQDGIYVVTLISIGICGNDTTTALVSIQTPPVAGFTYQQSDVCVPVVVNFTNLSSPNATSFAWTFPGGNPGTSNLPNPIVTYNSTGLFDVTLIAYSPGGSDTIVWPQLVTVGDVPNAAFLLATNEMTVNFTNQSTDADGYVWLFGDGQNSTEQNPSHTYASYGTYTVLLIASNLCGADTMSVVIELSTVPNSFFSYSAHDGCAPFQVQFIDQSQNNPTSWLWTFEGGDPATSSQQNPLVTYNTPGQYFVSLLVQNAQGSDVLVLDDLIQVSGAPDATFNHTQTENVVSLEYPGIDYDSLKWSFGDGRTDNSLNPTVEYSVSGQYQISLIVYNACGTDTTSLWVTIDITATHDPAQLPGNWQVRPNPVTDILTLYGEPVTEGKMEVILRDIDGKTVRRDVWSHGHGVATKQIPVDHLPAGLYLIELRDHHVSSFLRVVHL